MAKEIKTKSSFGTVTINHFSPALLASVPKGMNIYVSFEEALKLQLGLNQLLMKLNTYNRNTKEGKDACVNLCVFTDVFSITINEGQVGERKTPKQNRRDSTNLESQLKTYIDEVNATNLEGLTKQTYITHATNFVRWTKGDFTPGSRKG